MKEKISIGIVGYGTVGSNTAAVLHEKNKFFTERTGIEFHLKKVCDIDWKSKREWMPSSAMRTENYSDIVN
ncbi:MAG TPA: homoserine dehydrogenase, partial [bacterium]|nr:homoserine dehydrogenase [bacterium]